MPLILEIKVIKKSPEISGKSQELGGVRRFIPPNGQLQKSKSALFWLRNPIQKTASSYGSVLLVTYGGVFGPLFDPKISEIPVV